MKLSGYKKTIVILFACIITIIVALNVFTEEEVPLTDFIVEDLYIVLGETETIEVTTVPSNATIAGKFTFYSSDLAVASVGEADGIITGCTPGFSEITVRYIDERRDLEITKTIKAHVVFRPSEGALPYEGDKWNTSGIVNKRNCYSYAFNLFNGQMYGDLLFDDYYKYTPGDIYGYVSGASIVNLTNVIAQKAKTVDFFENMVIKDICYLGVGTTEDALIEVGLNEEILENDRYKVALFIQYSIDGHWDNFHWYRQNDDGTWSHKDGASPVTNEAVTSTPENKVLIYNPITNEMARTGYEYIGCYSVKPWNPKEN